MSSQSVVPIAVAINEKTIKASQNSQRFFTRLCLAALLATKSSQLHPGFRALKAVATAQSSRSSSSSFRAFRGSELGGGSVAAGRQRDSGKGGRTLLQRKHGQVSWWRYHNKYLDMKTQVVCLWELPEHHQKNRSYCKRKCPFKFIIPNAETGK